MTSVILSSLQRYAEMQACLFPLVPGTKLPFKDFEWKTQASSDPAQWALWHQTSPDANWAMHCGRSRMLVIDIDVKKVGVEKAWSAYLELLAMGGLPTEPTVSTPSGGWHVYTKVPANVDPATLTTRYLKGCIELRAGDSYVVIPPSKIGGGFYVARH